jgi:DNA-binding transcriptional LysR family regulator
MAKPNAIHNQGLWENRPMMRLRQLEVFRAVMAHGTVTAAARALRMSQPAATTAIRNLESGLGLDLFQRDKGRLAATPEAEALYREVDRIFRTVAVVEKFAHDLREAHSGVLTLACTPSLGCALLADEVARFRQRHPAVRVWLQVTTTREIIDQAHKRQIDFGVIYSPADESGLLVEPLYTTELVCVARPDHPLAGLKYATPKDLADHPILMNVRNDPIAALIEEAFHPIDVRHCVTIGTNHTDLACAMVVAGAGVALVEPISVTRLFPGLVQVPFRPRIPITPRIVASRQPMSRIARRFADTLLQATEKQRRPAGHADAAE